MRIHDDARFATRAIHAGQVPDPSTGAIMTPIFQTSTYVQDGPGVHQGYEYSRTQNPTRKALEDCMAGIEGGKHGLAFASGCAATSAIGLSKAATSFSSWGISSSSCVTLQPPSSSASK